MDRVIALLADRLRSLRPDRRLSRQDLRPLRRCPGRRCVLRAALKGPLYGVLGNHDTIRMVPGLEDMGIKFSSTKANDRAGRRAHLSRRHRRCPFLPGGQYREGGRRNSRPTHFRSCSRILRRFIGRPLTLISTLLSGHTHGGQICLPGGIPITLDSVFRARWAGALGGITA